MTIEQLPLNPATVDRSYKVTFSDLELRAMGDRIALGVMEKVATAVAERYLEEHGSEVLAKLSAEAIATMAVAEAGAAVNDTLKRQHADRPRQAERQTVILQRGIFGGYRRL